MANILIVEDDSALAMGIEYTLRGESFHVTLTKNIKDAREALRDESFDLIVLDIMLPDGNGYDLCEEIRRQWDIPIIFLTACDEEANIVMGLDMGGDDYITKPFRVRELVSRIRAVLRRSTSVDTITSTLTSDTITLYTVERRVEKEGKEIYLTPSEYKLLHTLMDHPRQVLTRDIILGSIWDSAGNFVDDNTLSVYIRRLREKIEVDPAQPVYIITVRGLGYRWDKDVIKQ